MEEHMVESSAKIVLDLNEKIRVLHVDDDSGLLKIVKHCLEMEGPLQVDTALSVYEAFMKLENDKYDIVVSDYQMPERNGLEFLKELREKGNMIPFIIFTGKGREEIAIKALNLGADQYLNKTGDPETVYCELAHAIRITVERTKAESALETCGERYGRLFESAVDGILINGSDGRISSLNPAAADILGYNSPKELIGKPAVELYADPDSTTRLLQELMEKGYVKERELTWKKKDGTLIEILANITLKKDEKGNLLRTEGIIRDVSEKKRRERLLKESEEKYRELAESISDVFFAFDKDLRCEYWNKASEKLTGIEAKDAIGKSLTEVFPDVKGTEVEQFYRSAMKTKQHQTFVNKHQVGDRVFIFELDAYPTKDGLSVFAKDVTGRKKTEEALKESENYLKAVFSSIFTGVMVVNAETHEIVDANPNALAILGTSREQIIGRVCHNFICPADKGKCPISDLKQTVDNSERKLITADGYLKPIIKTVVSIKSKGQEYFVESFVDIAERKKAEEALRESEEKYKDLFENALDVILTLDLKGYVTAANSSILRFGYKKEDLVGKNILDFVSKAYSSTVMRDFSQVVQGEPAKNETEIVVPTGKILVEYNARPIAKESNVTGVQMNLRDMTERKNTEICLKESQRRFEGLFQGNPEAAAYLGPDYRIQDVNPRFETLFGYSLEEVKSKHINDVVVPDDRRDEGEILDRDARKGYVYRNTVRRKKDGSLVQVSVSAAPIANESGVTGIVAMYKDISDLKNAEKGMDVMNEKLRVVGGLTRHDVRNKLAAVAGGAYLLRKRFASEPNATEYLESIEAAVRESERIFDFASAYEKLGVEQLVYLDAKKILEEAIAMFPDSKGVRIVNGCDGLTLLADSLLRQLLYNLIDNSLKYGEKLTQIRIHYEKAKDQLKLVYEDDGVGISKDVKAKLFIEGFTMGKGSGYGLYLIRRMMEVYGWAINETGTHGKGALFTITIPKTNQDGKENYLVT